MQGATVEFYLQWYHVASMLRQVYLTGNDQEREIQFSCHPSSRPSRMSAMRCQEIPSGKQGDPQCTRASALP